MFDGVINIYKEPGFTSNDVVIKMRGILHMKKIGHTGTLDPAAEGVLPVCLGKATKLVSMLTDETHKTYQAVMLLGQVTDTQDTTGQVTVSSDVEEMIRSGALTEEAVRNAALSFIGDYAQIPPMYSALKVNGKRLYELAREGKEVERAARPVHIYDLTVDSIALPRVTMTVTCSRGTYIRTLCHDIGEKLGCGGCMEHLLRTKVGNFTVDRAIRLGDLETLSREGRAGEAVIPIDGILADLPAFHSENETLDRLLDNGNPFGAEFLDPSARGDGSEVRMYDGQGRFIGVYSYRPDEKKWKAVRIFK